MKKRRNPKKSNSIIKLSTLGVVLVIGFILSFATFRIPHIPIGGPQGINTYHSAISQIRLGIDLVGGIYAVYEAADDEDTADMDQRMEGTRARLQAMLVRMGFVEATVVREGARRLRVEVPDVDDPQEIFNIIGRPARLEFRIAGETMMEGDFVRSARPINNYDGQPAVALELTPAGGTRFYEITRDNRGANMDIVVIVGEDEEVVSSPTINDPIPGGNAIITGMASFDAARNLADQIMSGTFAVQLTLLQSDVVSPTLGANALRLSIIAGIIGVLLTMIFMCLFYRLLGVVTCISILAYTVIMIFLLAILPWAQLTLPGIAGMILGLGIAVDASILMFERIKDEYRKGKSINAAYHTGFRRAFWAIFDSELTGIIAGIALYIFGSGPVMSFALIFIVGIGVSMFVNLVLARMMVKNFFTLAGDRPRLFRLKRGSGVQEVPDDFDGGDSDKRVIDFEPVAVV